ncbi:MAG: DUF86 domain-containing protein [Bacteroidales bacterium]|nr:DUF86 domain-containing protein [Bacteroidales bacterium]
MDEYSRKYLQDVLTACKEIESFFEGGSRVFEDFEKDILRQRAVERNVEIMGEAINQMLKNDKSISLNNSKAIISTRNRVIHGYDSVTPEFLWSLVIRHIPKLQHDVESLLKDN